MAYNNGFQETYQNGYLQNNFSYPYNQQQYGIHPQVQGYINPMNQINQPQQQSNSGIIWVQGEAGAKAFSNIRPDIPVALWDSEEPVIYIKSIDNTGKPSMTILDYVERNGSESKQPDTPQVEYATKEQFENLNNQYSSSQLMSLRNNPGGILDILLQSGKINQQQYTELQPYKNNPEVIGKYLINRGFGGAISNAEQTANRMVNQ